MSLVNVVFALKEHCDTHTHMCTVDCDIMILFWLAILNLEHDFTSTKYR